MFSKIAAPLRARHNGFALKATAGTEALSPSQATVMRHLPAIEACHEKIS